MMYDLQPADLWRHNTVTHFTITCENTIHRDLERERETERKKTAAAQLRQQPQQTARTTAARQQRDSAVAIAATRRTFPYVDVVSNKPQTNSSERMGIAHRTVLCSRSIVERVGVSTYSQVSYAVVVVVILRACVRVSLCTENAHAYAIGACVCKMVFSFTFRLWTSSLMLTLFFLCVCPFVSVQLVVGSSIQLRARVRNYGTRIICASIVRRLDIEPLWTTMQKSHARVRSRGTTH